MNLCFCGWVGDCSNCCLCSEECINCYCVWVFGLLLDCIDLYISVMCMDVVELWESMLLGEFSVVVCVWVEVVYVK